MAATSHPLATQTAVNILLKGGNAMDAAIAACAVQCVVEPGSTGIGGDCFCHYAPQGVGKPIVYNGSGRAPGGAELSYFEDNHITAIEQHSPHSVTIPGAIDAWCRLHADHGKLDFAEILDPAIAYAENGYPIGSRVHYDLGHCESLLRKDATVAETFLQDDEVPPVGAVQRQPLLARSLRAIAENGRDVFYSGWVAEDIVDYLQSLGGLHTMADFAEARGEYVEPISVDYRGLTVFQCPPSGQGVTALMLLNLVDQAGVDAEGPLAAARIHTEIEAGRLAYRARSMFVGDPAFSEIPVEALLSKATARSLYDRIDPLRAAGRVDDIVLPDHRDTVYITVVDKDRNACSFINSLFAGFGSGLMAPKSGVLLHNRGQGFVLDAGHPNCIAPKKRPLHTLIPGMAFRNGRVALSYGVMGGQYQAFGHMQFLTRHLDFGLDLQEAMDLPRFMVDPFSGDVTMENGVGDDIRRRLIARGHRISTPAMPIGGSQAISIDWETNVLTGASDPRKDGCALGY
jgi:gamma-glutamyltranspeptidase/glutathione hydrolase